MDDRQALMRKLMICDFGLNEVNLFLDNHPTNQKALDYYKTTLAMRQKIADEYVTKYGPITIMDMADDNEWKWATTPWPWELEV